MATTWREIKYWIADHLFEYELDEAYEMGLKYGAEFATRTITFKVDVKEARQQLTKTQLLGYKRAQQIIEDCKSEIRLTTGAPVYEVDRG